MNVLQQRQREKDVRGIFEAAVRAVQAPQLLERVDWTAWLQRPLDDYARIVVAGLGKASMAMGGVVDEQLSDREVTGAVVVPEGYPASLPQHMPAPRRLDVLEGGHPVPTQGSRQGAERLLELAASCAEDDLLLILISGGGTALTFAPVEGVSLDDARRTFELLMGAGVDIHEMNAVRKHLSRLGGGQLARAASSGEGLALVVSDVPGDELSVIASGPTVPDPSTFEQALGVLRQSDLLGEVPTSVRRHLERGRQDPSLETPDASEAAFDRLRTELIGNNEAARLAAKEEAEKRGYAVRMYSDVTGEAREAGRDLARKMVAGQEEKPLCLIGGGETTVTLEGEGKGGRNQELALSAAMELYELRHDIDKETAFLLVSAGTDGIDGPTDAAGALVTEGTVREARRQGLDAASYLDNNNSYPFFDQLGTLIRTGPTHTNVMDVQVALVR